MSYRPITDVWILARSKVKYYGAFPAGFLERARELVANINDPVLFVCGGMVRKYPYAGGIGPHDKTLDLDPACEPNFLQDAREPFPLCDLFEADGPWGGVIIDRPYTEPDADHYVPGRSKLPPVNLLLKHALAVVPVGGKVGILDYKWPRPPKKVNGKPVAKEIALVAVGTGRDGQARWFTVWKRLQ